MTPPRAADDCDGGDGGGGALVSIRTLIVGEEPRYRWRRTLPPPPSAPIRQVVLVHIDRRWLLTPGASEWVSSVSSPATNRSGRTLEKGAVTLANWPAAFQISLTAR
jgi:hypothetical protein